MLKNFDASHAYQLGFRCAVCGGGRIVPGGTWIESFAADFREGWDDAVSDGKFGTDPEYCKRQFSLPNYFPKN